MPDTNEGTETTTEEAPKVTPEVTSGTPPAADEVTTLRSRNAGLDAKVTELTKAQKAAEAQAAEALAKLTDYEAGKVDADEALRAQLSAKDAELALIRNEAALAKIEAKYPETFGVLGEAAAALTADQLAASEARFAGVKDETTTPPVPVGTNAPRSSAPKKSIEDMSAAELRDYAARTFSRGPDGNPY